ncbi:MAG: hypothetical protein J0649_06835 [Methylococcales bacterium]|jgi:hypothetical protein|nr:hypothetical protein [Methylococcales bacterium]
MKSDIEKRLHDYGEMLANEIMQIQNGELEDYTDELKELGEKLKEEICLKRR